MDRAWISLLGAWDDRNHPSDFANSPILYGDVVLLCKEFEEVTRLVRRNKIISGTFGQFCSKKSDDAWDKVQDHRHGNGSYGNWISLYETGTGWKNLHCGCMGLPYFILFLKGKNSEQRRNTGERL